MAIQDRSLGVYWARVKLDGDYPIRRGAWYRVTQFAKEHIILEPPGTFATVPRQAVELVGTPPRRWTVVPRPPGATWLPQRWGQHYCAWPGCPHLPPPPPIPQVLSC